MDSKDFNQDFDQHKTVRYDSDADTVKNAGRISGLSIAAFITSALGCTFLVGLILGIIDLNKKDGRKRGLSVAAVIIAGVTLLLTLLSIPLYILGIFTPSYLQYTEKSLVAQDTMIIDTLRVAIMAAMIDPAVENADPETVKEVMNNSSWTNIRSIGSPADSNTPGTMRHEIEAMIGMPITDVERKVKSHHTDQMRVVYRVRHGQVAVAITTTDKTGHKSDLDEPDLYILVGDTSFQ